MVELLCTAKFPHKHHHCPPVFVNGWGYLRHTSADNSAVCFQELGELAPPIQQGFLGFVR